MIRRVSSSLSTFREVSFEPGFNVILAERTKDATKKDTRNGLGKSTLIDIIHFCLGTGFSKDHRLAHPLLDGERFQLDLELQNNRLEVIRRTDDYSFVTLIGDLDRFPLPDGSKSTSRQLSVKEWCAFLGQYWFGIPTDSPRKYGPTFRSIISFFIRSGKEAFFSPFRHYRVQSTWDMQVMNSFLLGLTWEDASDLEILREKRKALASLKAAAEDGFLGNVWGSQPQLEVDRVRLEENIKRTSQDLAAFRVLSQYKEVELQADRISRRAQELSDENASESRILQMYERSVQEESSAKTVNVEAIYKAASIELPELALRRLSEVEAFHRTVIENRKAFLLQEIDRLTKRIDSRNHELAMLNEEQARLLDVLSTHGALDQYTKLQQAHLSNVSRLSEVIGRLSLIRKVEENRSALKLESAILEQRARTDFEERHTERETAISIFDGNSQALYKAPGRLLLSVGDGGFKFDVQIERKGSTGISNMEIFCYDLMLAETWAKTRPNTIVLIHDSNIFADVDDRQIALALELAKKRSEQYKFQYICTFNSDKLPVDDFSPNFKVEAFTRLTLTDEDESGGLLGIRLPSRSAELA